MWVIDGFDDVAFNPQVGRAGNANGLVVGNVNVGTVMGLNIFAIDSNAISKCHLRSQLWQFAVDGDATLRYQFVSFSTGTKSNFA